MSCVLISVSTTLLRKPIPHQVDTARDPDQPDKSVVDLSNTRDRDVPGFPLASLRLHQGMAASNHHLW